ncbi:MULTISPECIES: tRNA-modifying protein YgfZ [unclassified Agarivorans]|uniref:tRNA-modifying protein YgfZ n=1 Tax=unclassified Agarivorans TaxID=2636026 RepID=UPI003D7D161B
MSQQTLCTLPPLLVQPLDQWHLVRVSGIDAQSYLQGQLSCDVNSLDPGQQSLAAHCDPTGKMWSVLRLLRLNDDYLYLQPKSLADSQLAQLKKYAVFSKVAIETETKLKIIAVLGSEAPHYIAEHFGDDIASYGGLIDSGICVHLDGPKRRYLVITDLANWGEDAPTSPLDANQLWRALQIVSGLPMLELATSQQFIPQALNLQCLNAISFSKGCYTGQETIARAKYRGNNKRATLRFAGHGDLLPKAGDRLEQKLGENWRAKATVLQAVQLDPGYIELLAVLNKDTDATAKFRLEGDEQSLYTIAQLPYGLED